MTLPELPDEIVKIIYDYNRPKLGFEFKAGQIFNCYGGTLEISKVEKQPFYNEIYIEGYHRFSSDEKIYFNGKKCFPPPNLKNFYCTYIPLVNKWQDMYIPKDEYCKIEIYKEMLIYEDNLKSKKIV